MLFRCYTVANKADTLEKLDKWMLFPKPEIIKWVLRVNVSPKPGIPLPGSKLDTKKQPWGSEIILLL